MRRTLSALTLVFCLIFSAAWPANAAPGDFVAAVTFSTPCQSGIGVGIAFDGTNLWYSCYESSPDLFRADPATGQVTASYNIAGSLGALAYDANRNAIWAGWGLSNAGNVYLLQLDAQKNVVSSPVQFSVTEPLVCDLDDGLAYDGKTDTLYLSDDCSRLIHHYSTLGQRLTDGPDGTGVFRWAGTDCYNSGLALGGDLLYEGADGCNHVYVTNKSQPDVALFGFSTEIAGDPNFRDEDLECDTRTFAALGKQVMWSKEAYAPMRAKAFEIASGSCGIGGMPALTDTLNYTGDLSGDYHDTVTLSASLRNPGVGEQPGAGKVVTFTLGNQTATAVTDANGSATTQLLLNQPSGSYPLTAMFGGDDKWPAAQTQVSLAVTREETSVVLKVAHHPGSTSPGSSGEHHNDQGDEKHQHEGNSRPCGTQDEHHEKQGQEEHNHEDGDHDCGRMITTTATLYEDGTVPISGRTVTFRIGNTTVNAVTDQAGVATTVLLVVSTQQVVTASFGGDVYYQPSSASQRLPSLQSDHEDDHRDRPAKRHSDH